MAAASSGTLVVLLIGILMMAGEFRHNTATSTFLISPDRRRVVGAKLIASAVVGAGLALAIALPWLAAKNVDVSLLSRDVGPVLLAAVAVAFVWVMVVEALWSASCPTSADGFLAEHSLR